MEQLKNKVIKKLISWGNNPNDVNDMVETHFDYVIKNYGVISVNNIANIIRVIY